MAHAKMLIGALTLSACTGEGPPGEHADTGSLSWNSPPMMFRNDPAHTGVYPGPAPTGGGDGTIRWEATIEDAVGGAAAIAEGMVYIATVSTDSDDGYVYALDESDGSEVWRTLLPEIGVSPAVVDGLVIVACYRQDRVYALDARTGEIAWSSDGGSNGMIYSNPTVADGVVYVGVLYLNMRGALRALDMETGSTRWSVDFDGGIVTSPAVSEGVVYSAGLDGMIRAHATDSGETLWERWAVNGAVMASPGVAEGVLYIGSIEGVIHAFRTEDGEDLWTYNAEKAVEGSAPAISEGVVYIGSNDGKLYALDKNDGTLTWAYDTGGSIFSSPAVVDDFVYFGARFGGTGKVLGLHASDGSLAWSLENDAWVMGSPAVSDGTVYVGTHGGSFLALE